MGLPDTEILMYVLLIQYPCLLFSLCFHEAAHAWTADRCGDPSARLLGRVTMNPIKHADPLGTVILPIFIGLTGMPFLFGWAKPVPFNPRNLGNIRRDPVLIAMAGPASNVLMTIVVVAILRALWGFYDAGFVSDDIMTQMFRFLRALAAINLLLAVFNMIPVPPLDGHYLLNYFLPPSGQQMMQQIGPMGIILAIFLARPILGTVMPPLIYLVDLASGSLG